MRDEAAHAQAEAPGSIGPVVAIARSLGRSSIWSSASAQARTWRCSRGRSALVGMLGETKSRTSLPNDNLFYLGSD